MFFGIFRRKVRIYPEDGPDGITWAWTDSGQIFGGYRRLDDAIASVQAAGFSPRPQQGVDITEYRDRRGTPLWQWKHRSTGIVRMGFTSHNQAYWDAQAQRVEPFHSMD